MSESLSDRFIFVMGELRQIESSVKNTDAERHAVRMAGRLAEKAIDDALHTAFQCIELSREARRACEDAATPPTTDPA
jgi:hypothetical protein